MREMTKVALVIGYIINRYIGLTISDSTNQRINDLTI